ncbi:MAG: hypothetical protein JXC33_13125 [Deltaproteobacteria bacterium]|nr:hypothetical protein [Deltaproteobacteria bacterium]
MKEEIHARGLACAQPVIMAKKKIKEKGHCIVIVDNENQGIGILSCGTYLNYFGLKDSLTVGVVSNMYDIAETMLSAGRVIRI